MNYRGKLDTYFVLSEMFFILELCYNKHKGNDRNLRPLLAGGWSFFCVIICIISLGGTTLRRKQNLFLSQNSIQGTKKEPARALAIHVERMKGVEPSCPAWEAGVLPMNYTRILMHR